MQETICLKHKNTRAFDKHFPIHLLLLIVSNTIYTTYRDNTQQNRHPLFYLHSCSMSIHEDFINEMRKLLPADEIDAFLLACEKPLKKSISACIWKINPDTFVALTKPRWRHLQPSPFHPTPGSYYIDRDDLTMALGKTFLYQAWFFYIQELAASLPASQITSKPGDLILDMAAAPWGKTTQLAHTLLAQGHAPWLVIANDIAPLRVKTMAHNLNMMWCYNTALTKRNGAMFGKHLPEFFDHALLDAPCSGEGTRFKSDSALSFWRKEEINKITWTQLQLLISAIKAVKPWGSIIYSTCTLNPYENEEILNRILEFFKGAIEIEQVDFHGLSSGVHSADVPVTFDTDKVARCRPHRQGTGGFFVSKLRKISSTHHAKPNQHSKLEPKNPFTLDMSKSLFKRVDQRLTTTYGIRLDPTRHLLAASKEQIYLCSPEVSKVQGQLHFEKIGIPILKIDRDLFRPTHYLGNILWHLATKNVVVFDDLQMQSYSEGKEIDPTSFVSHKKLDLPYQIIKRKDYGMSVVKILPEMIKNKWGR